MEEPTMPAWFGGLSVVVLLLMVDAWRRIIVRMRRGRPIIPRRRRQPVPWGLGGAGLAGVFLALSILGAVSAALSVETGEQPTESAFGLPQVGAVAMTWVLLTALSVAWLNSRYKLIGADFGAPKSTREAARDTVIGISACAAALPLVYSVQGLLVWWLGLPSSHPTVEALIADPTWELIASAVLLAVVIAPIFEELAFRVLLQGWLERHAGRRACWPIAVSSLAFALAHAGQGWAPVPLFVVAIVLGYLYRQTHRIAPIIAMHMTFNALSLAAAIATAQSVAAP